MSISFPQRRVLLRVAAVAIAIVATGCGDGSVVHPRGGSLANGAFSGPAAAVDDIIWKHRGTAAIAQTPAFAGDVLYLVSTDGTVAALDSKSGEEEWTATLGSSSRSSAVIDGRRVIVGHDRGITALGLDGQRAWSFDTGSPVEAPVVIADGLAIAGTRGGAVIAVDALTGSLVWKATTAGPITAPCAAVGGGVACGGGDGYLWFLSVEKGEAKWSWSPAAKVRGVASDGSKLFVVAGSRVRAVGIDEPKVAWSYDSQSPIETPPTVAEDLVVLGTASEVVGLSASDGSVAWRATVPNSPRGPITSSGGSFYVPLSGGEVVALGGDGAIRWRFRADGPVVAGPLPVDGRLFIVDLDGAVHAVE